MKTLPFHIINPNTSGLGVSFSELKGVHWGEKTLLFMEARASFGPYTVVVGFRAEEKRPDEKPGDTIMVEPVGDQHKKEVERYLREHFGGEKFEFFP